MAFPYRGSAGLFSTDDPAADARQILAEEYDPELDPYDDASDWEEEPWEELQYVHAIAGSTNCTWWHAEWIPQGTEDSWLGTMEKRHDQECGCNAVFSVAV